MSVIQNKQTELRYLRRKNLEEEAKVVGNYYRDIIRSYGVDVNYYKLNTNTFDNYKGIIDQNVLLKHAYGYDISPDYSMSAQMLSYMEVDQDIFQINKFGYKPDANVSFYFDSNDFACALASKLGQYRELKIDETEIECYVPEITDERISAYDEQGQIQCYFLSSNTFPYKLGTGMNEFYSSGMLSGKFQVDIPWYDLDKEYTLICDPYEHTLLSTAFKSNPSLYKTFYHDYCNTDYLQTVLYLTFTVRRIHVGNGINKCLLTGKLHGSVLFYDLNKVGKYIDKIHPEIGDIVTIDFPDENNREQYEITDAFDKSLQSDGISPLLHKYIWKCSARRHIDTYNEVEQNEANDRLEEKLKLDQIIAQDITDKISMYDDNQDAVYGGYGNVIDLFDKNTVDNTKQTKYQFIDDGTAIDLIDFSCGSKLVTTGYDLLFIDAEQNAYKLTTTDIQQNGEPAYAESDLKYLKASDDSVFFQNILGDSFRIANDIEVNDENLTLQLDSLFDKTTDDNCMNSVKDNFYKFRNTKTYLFATKHHLFCNLASNKQVFQII